MHLQDSAGKIDLIDHLLRRAYGAPGRFRGDPLEELVATILSQNTNDKNSRRAYDALREAFPTWRSVLRAKPNRLEDVLRPGGLARTKSRRIQEILRTIEDSEDNATDDLQLDCLRRLSNEEAEKYLMGFGGVGFKTARCVLLFALGRDVFPIDTHIERIFKRIGIIPAGTSVNEAHRSLPRHIHKGRCLSLHINLIRHGRRICHAQHPACADCVLRDLCAYYRKTHG